MARGKNDEMLVHFPNWRVLGENLKEDYCLSTKMICRGLKCSRDWFSKNIAPKLHRVYLQGMFRETGENGEFVYGLPWASIALREGWIPTPESVWYSQSDLWDLLVSNIHLSQASKKLPPSRMVGGSPEWRRFVEDIDEKHAKVMEKPRIDYIELFSLEEELRNAFFDNLTPTGEQARKVMIMNGAKRGGITPVPIDMSEEYEKLVAGGMDTVASMMDYGDAPEEHYRHLFSVGAVRAELVVGDARKVYYLPDPHPLEEGEVPLPSWFMAGAAIPASDSIRIFGE